MVKSFKKVLVVGSGLSAYGACVAMLERKNLEIDVVDIGLERSYINQSNNSVPNAKDIKGSFYPYGTNDNRSEIKLESKRISSSHAYGGYSKVYSGSIFRPSDKDLIDWPKNSIPQEIDYKTIINSLNIEKFDDELNNFPSFNNKSNKENIKKIYLGRARIAYSFKDKDKKVKIPFDSSGKFSEWKFKKKINYFKDRRVLFIVERKNKLEVNIESYTERKIIKSIYDYVYLACGCVNTTAIVDRSVMGKGKRSYIIKSCPGLIGLHLNLNFKNVLNKTKNNNFKNEEYQLSSYFLEQNNFLTSNLWSHTQIGGINKIIFDKIKIKLNKFILYIILKTSEYLKFSTTVFHSKLGKDSILLSEVNNGQIIKIIEYTNKVSLFQKLSILFLFIAKFKNLKSIPIPFMNLFGTYLKGNKLGGWHYGGTLPMKVKPIKKTECFENGSLKGIRRLYIVDSASFPSIPGSTVALLTMANAYRIAKNSITI